MSYQIFMSVTKLLDFRKKNIRDKFATFEKRENVTIWMNHMQSRHGRDTLLEKLNHGRF